MSPPASPRSWKEFDGRWSRAGRMERFIVVSVALHLLIGFCWGIPKYVAYRTKVEVLRKKAETEERQREQAEEAFAAAEETMREEEKSDLAETQLREFFEELARDLLSEEEMEKRWLELLDALSGDLADLAEFVGSDGFDELEADERVLALKERMIEELHDSIAGDLQEEWKKRYLDYLDEAISNLAKLFQKELDTRIGAPLARESQRLVDQEVVQMRRDLARAGGELRRARQETDALRGQLVQSNNRVARQADAKAKEHETQTSLGGKLRKESAAEKPDANAVAQLNSAIAQSEGRERVHDQAIEREAAGLKAAAGRIDRIRAPLKEAAAGVKGIAPRLAEKISAIGDVSVRRADDEIQAETSALAERDAGKALPEGKKAAATLAEASKEMSAAIKETGEIKAEDVVKARLLELLAELERRELKAAFEAAFRKEYRENALDGLSKMINDQFQEEAGKKGIVPPPLSIEKELAQLLGVKLPGETDAGETTTSQMREKHGLAELDGDPEDGGLEKKAHGRITGVTAKLIDEQMGNVVSSAFGNRRSWLFGDGAELDEGAMANVAFLDRLGNLTNQMGQGRREFLGRGDSASLRSARERRRALGRMRGRLRGLDIGFEKNAFLAMIEKMKNRDDARGGPFALRGEEGRASRADEETGLAPEFTLGASEAEAEAAAADDEPEERAQREVTKPTFKFNRFAGIPYLNEPIVIDGDLSDWKRRGIPMLKMARAVKGPNAGRHYPEQEFWLAYDARGLYVAVNARDTSGALENHRPLSLFWLNDCVEVWIDALNTKYSRRGEAHTHQFYAFPFGQKEDPDAGGYEAYFDPKGRVISKHPRFARTLMPRAGRKTAEGWTLELMIPKRIIRRGELKPGRIIGFTISCCTGTDAYYYWSFHPKLRTSDNPHTWGDVQLLGADAVLSLVDADGKEARSAVLPGQPLRIKVADGDMDLDETAKDRIRVSVAADSGDYEAVVLEETERSSGVFIGSIPTRPNIGAMSTGVLDLFEGESVEIVYIDQAQAFGERNVKVARRARAISAGAQFVSQ